VRILDSTWDSPRKNAMLGQETLKAMQACRGSWGIYIQADECLHEDGARILREVQQWNGDERVGGFAS